MSEQSRTTDFLGEAGGKWRGILSALGIDVGFLRGKHGPCPLCMEGRDRFRFDDKGGRGTWYCSACGHGDGLDLLMQYKGWDWGEAAKAVRAELSIVERVEPKPEGDPEAVREQMKRIWNDGREVSPGDLVDRYLQGRGLLPRLRYGRSLRFVPRCWYAKEGQVNVFHPALVAAIREPDSHGQRGVCANVQRIYLTPEATKIEGEAKKVMALPIPPSSAIRLFPAGPILGVAEGIETAYAANQLFHVPTWALVNAANLQSFVPPPEVVELWVFGDNDRSYAGQAAAYALAKRFQARKGRTAVVHIPDQVGYDWLDIVREAAPCYGTSPSSSSSTPPPSLSSTTPSTIGATASR